MKKFIIFYCFCIIFISCSKNKKTQLTPPDGSGYFSMKYFFEDYNTHVGGQPYPAYKITTINGVIDSQLVTLEGPEWDTIENEFKKTEIGFKEYIGQYKFSSFEDNSLYVANIKYSALTDSLATRQLDVQIDMHNNKVKYIYITYDHPENNFLIKKQTKFVFIPLKEILIHTETKNMLWKNTSKKVEYVFLDDRE